MDELTHLGLGYETTSFGAGVVPVAIHLRSQKRPGAGVEKVIDKLTALALRQTLSGLL